jgi:glycosyltransferase involved in cell wall biosynthesis
MTRLSIVTPTFRRSANLKLLIDSLSAQTLPRSEWELIVVDDASGDDTGDVLRDSAEQLGNLTYEIAGSNAGPARARNRGAELASGDLIVFLDDDVAAAPGLLSRHLAFHEREPSHLRALLGRVEWHPDLKVTPFMRWVDRTGLQFAFDTWLTEGDVAEPYRVFYMANISLKRRAFLDVGGFDERFPNPAFEDYELGWRLHQRGLTLYYDPAARAFHTRAIDLETFKRRMRMVAESAQMLMTLHPEFTLAETPLRNRVAPWRMWRYRLYAPLAKLIGDDVRLGRYYYALIGESYAEGVRRWRERSANEQIER